MKRIKKLLIAVAVMFSAQVFAYDTFKEEEECMQSMYGITKKERIATCMKVDASKADAGGGLSAEFDKG